MDMQILLWLQGLRTPFVGAAAYYITVLSETTALFVLVSVLYWCLSKKSATCVMLNFMLGFGINNLLKTFFFVPRPWVRDARIKPYERAIAAATGTSFPSGHTASAVAVYGGLGVVLWEKKRWVSWLLFALTLLIGLSRLALGVHTPQDVLVSLAIGIVFLFAVKALTEALEKRPNLDVAVTAVMAALGVGLFLLAHGKAQAGEADESLFKDAYTASGLLVGASLGWLLERRTVRFSEKGPIWFQIVKLVVGLTALIGLRVGLKPVCAPLGDALAEAVRYGLMMLFMLWLYPALFERVRRKIAK